METWLENMDTLGGFLLDILYGITYALILFSLSYMVTLILRGILHLLKIQNPFVRLGYNGIKYLLYLTSFFISLKLIGFDIYPLLTGLGLSGFALGLALKDIVSNSLSGFLLMCQRPFNEGDHITICGKTGVVREMNIRYTVLQSEAEVHLIPNSRIYTDIITKAAPLPPQASEE